MAAEGQTHSGCTEVTALRLEDDHERQPVSFVRTACRGSLVSTTPSSIATTTSGLSITGALPSTEPDSILPHKASADADPVSSPVTANGHDLYANIFSDATHKVLYIANAGDAVRFSLGREELFVSPTTIKEAMPRKPGASRKLANLS